jgi:2-C-methyl-D-erythritol 4-phosphate cytidylyltransferase
MPVWVIVLAAGAGSRFGGAKQHEILGERSVLEHSVAVASDCVDGVVVVCAVADVRALEATLTDVEVVVGGKSRSESVRCGLAAVPKEVATVLVHDAARPLASRRLFRTVAAAVESGADAVIPGVPVADTIKRVNAQPSEGVEAEVLETLDRNSLVSVQTPQGFRREALEVAHASGADATDDAGLVEAIGGKVVVIPGEMFNLKITTPSDLTVLKALMSS